MVILVPESGANIPTTTVTTTTTEESWTKSGDNDAIKTADYYSNKITNKEALSII